MKIGTIFCGFDCDSSVSGVLEPWLILKEKYNIINTLAYGPFKGYLSHYKYDMKLPDWSSSFEYVYNHNGELEHDVRDKCLQYLLSKNVDYVWIVDFDEYYKIVEIENIISFIKKNKDVAWFKICFKNYIFDNYHFLATPFQPPRIFARSVFNYELNKFYWDNDVQYLNKKTNTLESQYKIGYQVIPRGLAFIKHLTWLNDERSIKKIDHQNFHYGDCSYKWDYENNKLAFNEEYFKKNNLPIPLYFKEKV